MTDAHPALTRRTSMDERRGARHVIGTELQHLATARAEERPQVGADVLEVGVVVVQRELESREVVGILDEDEDVELRAERRRVDLGLDADSRRRLRHGHRLWARRCCYSGRQRSQRHQRRRGQKKGASGLSTPATLRTAARANQLRHGRSLTLRQDADKCSNGPVSCRKRCPNHRDKRSRVG